MNCLESREVLQARLDGDAAPLSDAVKVHLAGCGGCRGLFAGADLLLKTLASKPPITAPSNLTDRLVTFAISDRERRRQRSRTQWTAIIGLAASVLLLVLAGQLITRPGKPLPNEDSAPIAENKSRETPIALAPRAEEARQAVAGLTERIAEETREQAKLLWSVAAPQDLAAVDPMPMEPFDPLEPAAEAVLESGRQVREGFQPVTRTARQAFSFLAREFAVLERPEQ